MTNVAAAFETFKYSNNDVVTRKGVTEALPSGELIPLNQRLHIIWRGLIQYGSDGGTARVYFVKPLAAVPVQSSPSETWNWPLPSAFLLSEEEFAPIKSR